jgi:hypothetical protein
MVARRSRVASLTVVSVRIVSGKAQTVTGVLSAGFGGGLTA